MNTNSNTNPLGQTKICANCGAEWYRPITMGNSEWKKRQCCSTECSHKLRLKKMGIEAGKLKQTLHPNTYAQLRQRLKDVNTEGKRAEVKSRYKKVYREVSDEDKPAYKAQRAHDKAVDAKYDVGIAPVKIYTPEEIAAIAHEITPIERVKNTVKPKELLFAEIDGSMPPRRRHEETGCLFSRGKV